MGLATSVAGLAVLVVMASHRGGAMNIAACTVYGATLVLLYLASTLYHASQQPEVQRVMRIIDHAAIYLLIPGRTHRSR